MNPVSRRAALGLLLGALAACGRKPKEATRTDLNPGETPELRRQIERYAAQYDVPVELVHRVVKRESGYNAKARNGRYFGLMQIDPRTAFTMGYRGRDEGLLNADTNLKYGVKYLRGAWLVSDGNQDKAISWYSQGYYYEAKRRGLLVETGLRSA
ncbi:MAG: transglycosylase [Cereibacter sphaeroides]|uniref:Transglycosylase n=1 Tax=Cereibacter sphaeroides TaxID=1063 RepID=A0A2W5SJJ0_CERSP|nr:MAG: transglycosylase [Cereibacter sphaeroides]